MTKENVLEKVIFHANLRGLSENTQDEYCSKVKMLQNYYDKPATELDIDDVQVFLHHIYTVDKLSSSSVNTYNSAIRFLYNIALDMPINVFKLPRHKRNRKIPSIFTRQEIVMVLDSCDNLRDKCMLMIMYSAGLRIDEVASLKISDIDSDKMQIFIDQGKGKKDGFAILSNKALTLLRQYWKEYKPKEWLFYSRNKTGFHITTRAIRNVFKKSVDKCGITKAVTTHSLRHSFATHLLEDGVNIFHIKQLLRHAEIKSTCFYLQMIKVSDLNVTSPLDKFLN